MGVGPARRSVLWGRTSEFSCFITLFPCEPGLLHGADSSGHMIHRNLMVTGVFLAAAAFGAGCGPRELSHHETYPVQGTVRLHGQPAAFVIVHLEPATPGKGVAAEGTTKEDGSFELRTYSNEDNDGAVSGDHEVTLEEFDPVRSGGLPKGAKPTPIPKGTLETGVIVTIKAEPNTTDIDVP